MKVKCIRIGSHLTIGKTYDVITENMIYYWVIDDKGKEDGYLKDRFIPLSELRNETINKLLEYEN